MACKSSRFALIGAVCSASIAGHVSAQSRATYLITVSNFVSPSQPSTTIEIWATWTGADFFFAGGNYDLTASDSTFSNPTNILNGPGSSAGVALGNTVTGATNGQLNLPGVSSNDNPILLASYTWTTSDFTSRTVFFDSSNTSNFSVFNNITGEEMQLFPNSFQPGSGSLLITPPSPATLTPLVLGGLVSSRRKRRS